MNGAELLVRLLQERGVTFITTLSGNGLDPFYEASRRASLRLIDFRNEQAAAFAADAAARLTGQLAVCAVNAAVGHANALIGVLNAWYAGAPLLLLSGASDHGRSDQGKFQDLDQVTLAASLCKYARLVDRADRIAFYLDEAIARATTGRPGPVHLTIPANVLNSPVERPDWLQTRPVAARVQPRAAAAPDQLAAAIELLAASARPLVVAGTGAFYAAAGPALVAFAAAIGAPIVTPIWDQGVIDQPQAQFMGVIGAASGGPALLPAADLVLLVGARIDYRVGYAEPPGMAEAARLIRIDIDAGELHQGRVPDVAIVADPAAALTALTAAIQMAGYRPRTDWLSEAQARHARFHQTWPAIPLPAPSLTGHHLVAALRPLLDDRLHLLIDGGNIGQWAHVLLANNRYPGHWLTCGPSGVVGWGIPGAIATKLVHPDRPVLLLTGDGAIGFALIELETAVRHRTPFVVLLADDHEWGSVVTGQTNRHGPDAIIASRLGPVAYDQVAAGLGALGVRINEADALGPAITAALAAERPTLIHVPIVGGAPA